MKIKHIYLALCVVGAALPYSQFLPWLAHNGLNLPLMVAQLFDNGVGAFFGVDVIVSAIVLIVFISTEGRRGKVPARWLPVAATLLVGISLGLPLFLYLRERAFERMASAASA